MFEIFLLIYIIFKIFDVLDTLEYQNRQSGYQPKDNVNLYNDINPPKGGSNEAN